MNTIKAHIALLILIPIVASFPIASTALCQDKHAEFWKLVETVQDILAGQNVEQARAFISPGARLVYGAKDELLRDVVAGDIKTISLADTSYKGVMISAETNPSEDAGYVLLKTQKPNTLNVRYHTVVFMRDSTGQYKIRNWHAGDTDR